MLHGEQDGVGSAADDRRQLRLFIGGEGAQDVVDPVTRRMVTLAGSGRDDVFFEPGGVGVGLGWLWVADTNHHAVKAVDLSTGAVRALALSVP